MKKRDYFWGLTDGIAWGILATCVGVALAWIFGLVHVG